MEFQCGDILACFGTDRVSRMISLATFSPFARRGLRLGPSHVALIVGGSMLVESTSLCERKCLITNRNVSGLQAHIPQERIEDYIQAGGRVDVYRLTRGNRLTRWECSQLTQQCTDWIIEGADYNTGGAALSGTRVFSLLKYFPDTDLQRVFCSEFVAWALQSLNRMNRDNPSRYNPGRLLRQLVSTSVYHRVDSIRSSL